MGACSAGILLDGFAFRGATAARWHLAGWSVTHGAVSCYRDVMNFAVSTNLGQKLGLGNLLVDFLRVVLVGLVRGFSHVG